MHDLDTIVARNSALSPTRQILNIGMAREGMIDLQPIDVLQFLVNSGEARVHKFAVHQSDTETTLVVELDALPERRLFAIAKFLSQEAIAVLDSFCGRLNGRLIGPNAQAWGKFDPKRFLQLDGSRLEAE